LREKEGGRAEDWFRGQFEAEGEEIVFSLRKMVLGQKRGNCLSP